ncbi:MAG: hypothetical protein HXY34_05150 [Candidatus Thorarchaeota archaeon]|nr:hypothetical protein [Candidatus Thorarchaeota archaeon]
MMNEYSVLMRLLTRTGTPIGAAVEDMLDALGLPEDFGRHVLFRHLAGLQRQLALMGMTIRHNPVDHVFYVETVGRLDGDMASHTLPDRLAATLLVVITLAYQQGGWVAIDSVRELRKKTRRGIIEDIRELESKGYLEVDATRQKTRPGSRVGFEIDYDAFFRRLDETRTE